GARRLVHQREYLFLFLLLGAGIVTNTALHNRSPCGSVLCHATPRFGVRRGIWKTPWMDGDSAELSEECRRSICCGSGEYPVPGLPRTWNPRCSVIPGLAPPG